MKACIDIVGAGPGAEDLLTVRGLQALRQADLVVYAGSLVNPALLKACKPDCVCLDSSSMNLDQQISAMSQAALEGKKVVRLHTGDPSVYGAINEQIRALAEKGIAVGIIPGVSSVFAAAAALGCELTAPDSSQSVVLTRAPGRTPMPKDEDAAIFAGTGATLAFFLSAGDMEGLMRRLMREGNLADDTPAAVVYRASWPDETILRGTVGSIASQARAAGLCRQAIILVGRALASNRSFSRLYDAGFSHGYRNNLASEYFEGRCALYAFTEKGLALARRLAAGLNLQSVIHSVRQAREQDIVYVPAREFDNRLAANWNSFEAHIFISATGMAVRKIAPFLQDKTWDPAVIACAENGSHAVSLTSGHLGGANRLARRIARLSGGQAVISTATDVNGLTAFDEAAALEKARILNTEAIRDLNSALLEGEGIAFCGNREIFQRYFAARANVSYAREPASISCGHAILWDSQARLPEHVRHLDITEKAFVLGLGCRRGIAPAELAQKAGQYLEHAGIQKTQLSCLATCHLKADEAAVLELARAWNLPINFYDSEDLDAVPVARPSATVREKTGSGSVCEAASLLAAGYGLFPAPRLYAPKSILGNATFALARMPHLEHSQNRRGYVTVIGLGSGSPGQITPEASRALHKCDTVAGYSAYVDLIRNRIAGKTLICNGMKGEMERCKAALEAALSGRKVCMVCSGDPGILAMAGLLFELRHLDGRFRDIPIKVLPGITAASIAASCLGAPLQNGFCLLSLSDLLVPEDEILLNLRSVAKSRLPVTLYNPAGRKRRDLLRKAVGIFRELRGDGILSAYVRNAGRDMEEKWIGALKDLPLEMIDMSAIVLIGGVRTRFDDGVLYDVRGYVEKYLK